MNNVELIMLGVGAMGLHSGSPYFTVRPKKFNKFIYKKSRSVDRRE